MHKERDISLIIGSLLVVFLFGIYGSIGIKEAIAPVKEPENDILNALQEPPAEPQELAYADAGEEAPVILSSPIPLQAPAAQPKIVQNQETDCAFGGCFEENLRICKPDTKVLADAGMMMRFDILFPTYSGCTVKITYANHANEVWRGSYLQCVVQKETPLLTAIDESFRLAKVGSSNCDGTMVALLRQN